MSSLVDRVLLELARLAGEDGCAVPQIASAQARRAAEQLVAAVGPTRVEPQPAIAATPAWAGPTTLAETVVMPRQAPQQAPAGGSGVSRRYRGWDR